MKTAIFVDFPEQIPLLRSIEPDASARLIVAARPLAAVALERAGLPFHYLEEFYDHRRLRQYDDDYKYPRLEAACHAVDRALAERIGSPDAYEPLYWNYLDLTFLWDNVVMTLAQGDAVIKAIRPDRLICFKAPAQPANDFQFSRDESLAGLLLPIAARHHGVPLEIVPFIPDLGRDGARRRKTLRNRAVRFALRAHHALRQGDLLAKLRKRVRQWASRPRTLTGPGDPHGVLMLMELCPGALLAERTETWSWHGFDQAIHRLPDDAVFNPPDLERPRAHSAEDIAHALAVPELAAACRYEGMDWSDFARDRLAQILEVFLPDFEARYARALRAVKTIRPGAVLAANLGDPFQKTVAAAARVLGIPVICTHHGQMGDQIELSWGYIELPFCTHYLIHAPAAERYIREKLGYDRALKMIVTGNPYLDGARKPQFSKRTICTLYGLDRAKPLAVYVTIPPAGNRNRLAYTDTDNTLYRNGVRMCETLLAQPDLQIVVKGLTGDTARNAPLMGWIAQFGQDRVRYVNDMSFGAFLDAADLIIVDFPGLTLMECLTRTTPLYIRNDSYRWVEEAVDLLRGEAVFEYDMDIFCARLGDDLRSGKAFERRTNDGRYMRHYGDPFGDGKTAMRVADTVAAIARGEL